MRLCKRWGKYLFIITLSLFVKTNYNELTNKLHFWKLLHILKDFGKSNVLLKCFVNSFDIKIDVVLENSFVL